MEREYLTPSKKLLWFLHFFSIILVCTELSKMTCVVTAENIAISHACVSRENYLSQSSQLLSYDTLWISFFAYGI
jgi:hypothetical protein